MTSNITLVKLVILGVMQETFNYAGLTRREEGFLGLSSIPYIGCN